MPVKTFNALGVSTTWTLPAATYAPPDRPWLILDVHVNGTDVVAEIAEEPNYSILDTQDSEILLRAGFQSVLLPPFYAVKFKVWGKTTLASSGTLDITLKS